MFQNIRKESGLTFQKTYPKLQMKQINSHFDIAGD